MKTGFKCLIAFMFGLCAVQGESAERLGGISDETAPVVNQPQQAADREDGIVYRVICSPEGEMLPECGQPPINDSFKAAQPSQTGPEVPDMPGAEAEEAGAEQGSQAAKAPEPAVHKKAATHKKHSKKSAKKTHPPAKKSKRR